VKAIKEGAEQFLTKPVMFSALLAAVQNCMQNQQNQRKQLARKMVRPRYEKDPFQGASASIQRLAQESA